MQTIAVKIMSDGSVAASGNSGSAVNIMNGSSDGDNVGKNNVVVATIAAVAATG